MSSDTALNPLITPANRQYPAPTPVPASLATISPAGNDQVDQSREASFAQTLANVQESTSPPPQAPVNVRQSLHFLVSNNGPRSIWPWTQTGLYRLQPSPALTTPSTSTPVVTPTTSTSLPSASLLALADYPHPPGDNGRGIHWIPTVSQSPEVVDRFVNEAAAMGMKWVVFLNEGTQVGANDYLVKRLVDAGIEPVMRVYTPGLVPIQGDLGDMVRHYNKMGVHYFQLYNEPNLMVETGGQPPNVDKYLDLWTPAAQEVVKAGGLPGFGALSPQGEMDDRVFLQRALAGMKARGQAQLLGRSWLAMHNYTGPRALTDPDGFLRFQQYDRIIESTLGRPIPIIGTEGGTHITQGVSEQQQVAMVTGAYDYMRHREPYNFAYTYWIIANGHDPAWDSQALIRTDGPTALAQALKNQNSGNRV